MLKHYTYLYTYIYCNVLTAKAKAHLVKKMPKQIHHQPRPCTPDKIELYILFLTFNLHLLISQCFLIHLF